MRSLEYMDPQGISLFNHEKMHFLQLENLIGQFPFSSPTVFTSSSLITTCQCQTPISQQQVLSLRAKGRRKRRRG